MNPEDRLRDLLRGAASSVNPAGDGLTKIQHRLARRRRRRVLLVPGAALATAGAVTAFFVLGGSGGTQKLVQTPTSHGPSPVQPTIDPRVRALWPFTTDAEATAWQTDHRDKPWANDLKAVGQHFAEDYLGLHGITAGVPSQLDRNGGIVVLTLAGQQVATLEVIGMGQGSGRPLSVVSSVDDYLHVTSPRAGSVISSPTSVSGRVRGVDENVRLRLLTDQGKDIASAGAPAGSEVPWQGQLSWSDSSWTAGAIVATTYSPKDGALTSLVVVPVLRTTPSCACSTPPRPG